MFPIYYHEKRKAVVDFPFEYVLLSVIVNAWSHRGIGEGNNDAITETVDGAQDLRSRPFAKILYG